MKDTSLLKSGERLSELLNQGMTWTPGQAFALIEPVAEQAALAHEQGKQAGLTGPEDIFITERLWFCFFTASQTEKKLAGQAGKGWPVLAALSGEKRAAAPAAGEKSPYIPLEIWVSGEPAGPRSEVYSLCAVIYHMITGVPPADASQRMKGQEAPPPSRLGIEIDAGRETALMKGLALLEKDRYSSCGELARALWPNTDREQPDSDQAQEDIKKADAAASEKKAAGVPSSRAGVMVRLWANRIALIILLIFLVSCCVILSFINPMFNLVYVILLPFALWAKPKSQVLCEMLSRKDGGAWDDYMLGTDVRRYTVISVTFLDQIPALPAQKWDVSAHRNKKVMAWREPEGDGYHFYIGAQGGVTAGTICDRLFSGCSALREVRFQNAFDTSHTVSMQGLFDGCASLERTDIDSLDLSRVRKRKNMWRGTRWE